MTWLYICLAAGIGALLVGMIGFGSSLVILPVLMLIFPGLFEPEIAVRLAVGTTMATMIVGAISAGVAQVRSQNVCWSLFRLMMLPYLIGAGLGPWFSQYIPVDLLSYYIVAILLVVSIQTLRRSGRSKIQRQWTASQFEITLVHLIIGLVSSIAGIASGVFAIPYLSRFALSLRTVIGTSTVAAAFYSMIATSSYITAGLGVVGRPEWSLGYIYLPAFAVMSVVSAACGLFGVRLGAFVSEDWLRRIVAVFLIVAAIAIAVR